VLASSCLVAKALGSALVRTVVKIRILEA
jgi:hypothetical protein